jgi:hypothetical protein
MPGVTPVSGAAPKSSQHGVRPVSARPNPLCAALAPPAPLGWRYLRTVAAIGSKSAVETCRGDSWLQHQGRQPGDEIQRLPPLSVCSSQPFSSCMAQATWQKTNPAHSGVRPHTVSKVDS